MTSPVVITTHRTTQEGDGRFASVTLFSLALVALVAGSFLYAYRELQPRDLLVPYVPADATAYVHFRTLHADMRDNGYALFDLPAGLTPDEVASFRVIDADGVGHWSTIAAWDDAAHITADERSVIAETVVSWLDEKTLVITDEEQDDVPTLLAVRASGTSLDTGPIANGLRQMRSVAPVQGYLKSLTLPDDAPSTAAIFGTVFGDAGSSMTLIRPVDAIPEEKPLLGLDARSGASPRPRTAADLLALPDALTVQRRFAGEPATPSMLINGLADAIKDYGSPADVSIKEAAGGLFALLRPPFALSVSPDRGNTVLHLPHVLPELLMSRIDGLLAAVFPPKRNIALPDGTIIHEFYREAAPASAFVAAGPNKIWPVRVDPANPSGLAIFVAPDDTGGAILSTTEEALADARPFVLAQREPAPCQTLAGYAEESLTVQDVSALTEDTDLFTADPIARLGLKKADFLKISDGMAVVCGYAKELVDK